MIVGARHITVLPDLFSPGGRYCAHFPPLKGMGEHIVPGADVLDREVPAVASGDKSPLRDTMRSHTRQLAPDTHGLVHPPLAGLDERG